MNTRSSDLVQVSRPQLIDLAIRCLSRALALQPQSPGMWHEVCENYNRFEF